MELGIGSPSAQRDAIASLAGRADQWNANAGIQQLIPDLQSHRPVRRQLYGVDVSENRVGQCFRAGTCRRRTRPNDQPILPVTLFAPITQRPIVGCVGAAEGQRVNNSMAMQER